MKINKHFKNTLLLISLVVITFVFNTGSSFAQSLGDPIIDITFGSGTAVRYGPLPADSGATTLIYNSSGFPNDDYYTIANTTDGMLTGWWTTTDHTGNPGGYMMVVNGSYDPGIFYTRTVAGLCGNTTYQFAAWIKNLLNYNGILPNVTFSIETTTGTVLGTGNTGDIQEGNIWIQYPFTFTTPVNTESIVLKMTNNASGGIGNDIVIDDITFRPYGSQVSAVFSSSSATQTTCAGNSQSLTIKATTTLAGGYEQKLQEYVNGTWTDESAPTTASLFSIMTPATAGTYSYRLVSGTTSNISTSECVVASNELTLTVTTAPTAAFSAAANTCLGNAEAFTDQSTSNNGTISGWLWNFGDGQISTIQNPSHTYTSAGNFAVQLTVKNSNGCSSATISQNVEISALPVPAFSYNVPDCPTSAITFTDGSTTATGSIITWVWDFGDGITETKTTNQAFQHTFAVAGSYMVKLTITNTTGCSASITQVIKINPLPIVSFTTPAVCLADADAAFNNTSTIADNTGGFTYLWNFGDPNANAGNPNTSALQNPTHKYSEAAVYQVSLMVISASGCSSGITKSFTVNGSVPAAAFSVVNAGELCSDHAVNFTNQSTVNFGSITKIELYYDYLNNPTLVETDNNPVFGGSYTHTYITFHTPATQNYQVRMLAYSGGTCVSELDKTITLLATPELSFPAVAPVCENAGNVQLAASELSGIAGTGAYSGTGVSSNGLFDPANAGAGTFTITYAFTAANACTETTSQTIIVNAAPTAYAGDNTTILQGGSTDLHGTASGDSLTYLWTPATGLSNPAVLNPTASPTADITYTLTITTSKGCTATSQVTVSVLKSPVIPNTFTPNGDGINDKWDIKYLDSYVDCTVQIFNRYGQKLYASIGYPTPWDGRYNGRELPSGVYYYIIDPKHNKSILSGWVTILR